MKNNNHKAAVPGEWLYLAPEGVSTAGIGEALGDSYQFEIWAEAGVLEVQFLEDARLDIEQTQIHPKDEITKNFAEENGCGSIFLVTFLPEHFEEAKKIMQCILSDLGGLFCGDTEDFMPVIRGEK